MEEIQPEHSESTKEESEIQISESRKIKQIVCSGGGHNGFIYYGILRELNKKG
jgi:hypothetical protein